METEKRFVPGVVTKDGISMNPASASKSMGKRPAGFATIAGGRDLPLTPKQEEILESRGIDLELATRMGWRNAGRKGTGDTIEIPYLRDGVEVNCKTRTLSGDKLFWQQEGGGKCFYNVDALKEIPHQGIVITEGEMDCIIALQCGFMAVSVPDGAPKDAIGDKDTVKYGYLKDMPKQAVKIILAVDNDNAGANLFHDLQLRLGAHRCLFVKYPDGCKDLNDVYKMSGRSGVMEVIEGAQFQTLNGLYTMDELPPLPKFEARDVGIVGLEDHLRLRRGDFSVVTGIPSHGKSTFINEIAHNMAVNSGWKTCFASFEQPPQTEHRRALRTLHSGRPEHLMKENELLSADDFIKNQFVFIVPTDDFKEHVDLQWLLDRMAMAVTRHQVKMIVIDPWNDMEHQHDSHSTMTQYVGNSIRHLKQFARVYQVHVMVIAHPAKLRKEKESGQYPIPTAYDISDSAHWYNKPDQVIVIHRKQSGNTLVRVAKSRYHYALGKPGDVELKFDDYDYRFKKPLE